jgi:putative sigma-54 modulation protein
MITKIHSIHFDADVKLLQQIEDRISHLSKFLQNKAVEANVILKLEKVGQVQDKVIEIIIALPGQLLVAKRTRKSFEKALIEVLATIKSQLIRYKRKIQRKY